MLRLFKKKDPLTALAIERSHCLKCALPETIKANLQQPLPAKNTPFKALSFLVVDFETTGFDPQSNDIISIGWVEINNMQIDLATKQHLYICAGDRINHQTAVINHIVPQMVSQGVSLSQAINSLMDHCKDKILVVHGKVIEKNFVDYYAQQTFAIPELPLIWLDTMQIEQWYAGKTGANIVQDNRLATVRKRYNLPQYSAHNALIDALATAELLIAQVANMYRDRNVSFSTLYAMSQ